MLLSRQVQSRKLRSKGAHTKKTSSFTNVNSERASSSPQSPHNKTGLMQIPPPQVGSVTCPITQHHVHPLDEYCSWMKTIQCQRTVWDSSCRALGGPFPRARSPRSRYALLEAFLFFDDVTHADSVAGTIDSARQCLATLPELDGRRFRIGNPP